MRASPPSSVSNAFKEMTAFELMTTVSEAFALQNIYLFLHQWALGSRNPCFDPLLYAGLI